jgi:hypothetical protein
MAKENARTSGACQLVQDPHEVEMNYPCETVIES